ncbi:unnamed protein product [Caenorhabditis angaria]|uniref:Uncharacterized protein n=1 Tax=Caenorhabditis angaria TaxID=860376 RepID=A0A9P1MUH6_9PELO|nr:unnamed protein product [Caenorhabditis angaria]
MFSKPSHFIHNTVQFFREFTKFMAIEWLGQQVNFTKKAHFHDFCQIIVKRYQLVCEMFESIDDTKILADISATVREKRQNSYSSSSSCSLNNTSKHDGHKLVELESEINSISLKTHEEIEPKTPTLDEELPLLTEDKEEDAKTEEIIDQPNFYNELMNPEISVERMFIEKHKQSENEEEFRKCQNLQLKRKAQKGKSGSSKFELYEVERNIMVEFVQLSNLWKIEGDAELKRVMIELPPEHFISVHLCREFSIIFNAGKKKEILYWINQLDDQTKSEDIKKMIVAEKAKNKKKKN